MGADDGEPGRPHHLPEAGRGGGGARPGQGRGGLRGDAVHAAHGLVPPALGVPRPRLPHLRGRRHHGDPRAPLARRRHVAAHAPHGVHPERRRPDQAARHAAAAHKAHGRDLGAAAAAGVRGRTGVRGVGVVLRRAGLAHRGRRRRLLGHDSLPQRPAHALQAGEPRGAPAQAPRSPWPQPRRRQVRQECHELRKFHK